MPAELEVPVLVAGGGSVGLSAAVFLAHHGVPAFVVERRDGPSVHPRATGIGPRSLEFFREVGIDEAVNAVAVDMTAGRLGKIYARTLAEADLSTGSAEPRAPLPADAPAEGPPGAVRPCGTRPGWCRSSRTVPASPLCSTDPTVRRRCVPPTSWPPTASTAV